MKIEVDPNGYVQVREGEGSDLGRRVALHRLNAYAWGLIDSIADEREVDHVTPVPWLNAEWNLEAVGVIEHGRLTRARERRRKRGVATLGEFVADGGGGPT